MRRGRVSVTRACAQKRATNVWRWRALNKSPPEFERQPHRGREAHRFHKTHLQDRHDATAAVATTSAAAFCAAVSGVWHCNNSRPRNSTFVSRQDSACCQRCA
jgi:hypothetical protein